MKKILILDVYYPAFLKDFYNKHPRIKDYAYEDQKKHLMNEMFGTADFYSKALSKLGSPTQDIIANDTYLQKSWLKKYGKEIRFKAFEKGVDIVKRRIPFVGSKVPLSWELNVLKQEIDYYKPDIIYSHNLGYFDPLFLKSIKNKTKLLVGQIASPLPPKIFLKPYDLIITSFPHFVKRFKKMGISSEYLPLCFEPTILKKFKPQKRIYNITFVGGISKVHKKGLSILYKLAEEMPIDVWGYGKEEIDHSTNLYKYHHGEAWGRDMYKILLQSKITINRHIDVAENYANNMRLFEATGCGAMLITDKKKNLNKLFNSDKEVATYSSINDLIRKIKYYLTNDKERVKIARAGQARTLKDHSYSVRMKELIGILDRYL